MSREPIRLPEIQIFSVWYLINIFTFTYVLLVHMESYVYNVVAKGREKKFS